MRSLQIYLDDKPIFAEPYVLPEGILEAIQLSLRTTIKNETPEILEVKFSSENAVSDRVRYWFEVKQSGPVLRPVDGETFTYMRGAVEVPTGTTWLDFKAAFPRSAAPIVVILESPHYFETKFDLTGRYPAAGKTGLNFHLARQQVAEMLQETLAAPVNTRIPVMLSNSVPFPASCRVPGIDADLRDEVFRHLMPFTSTKYARLLQQSYKPRLIVNACTGTLKARVNEVVKSAISLQAMRHYSWENCGSYFSKTNQPTRMRTGVPIISVSHPVDWNASAYFIWSTSPPRGASKVLEIYRGGEVSNSWGSVVLTEDRINRMRALSLTFACPAANTKADREHLESVIKGCAAYLQRSRCRLKVKLHTSRADATLQKNVLTQMQFRFTSEAGVETGEWVPQ